LDNLTHSLVGALIGQAGLKRKTGLAMPALIIGANLPDVDAACLFWLDGVEHLGFRRGITHGPIAWVVLPLMLAGALWGYDRWQAGRRKRPEGRLPVSFKWLFLLSFISCLTHPALDWLNVYGIRLLEPFSSQWFYGDTLFIIDVWLWALMGFATWFSLRREGRGGDWMKPARWAMVVALAYIGVNWIWSANQTSTLSEQLPYLECTDEAIEANVCDWTVIASPVPFKPWHRELITDAPNAWHILDAGKPVQYDLLRPVTSSFCREFDPAAINDPNLELEAFLFWSRAPFAERAPDGSVILRDARFYSPLVRDRFSVALPQVKCEELPSE